MIAIDSDERRTGRVRKLLPKAVQIFAALTMCAGVLFAQSGWEYLIQNCTSNGGDGRLVKIGASCYHQISVYQTGNGSWRITEYGDMTGCTGAWPGFHDITIDDVTRLDHWWQSNGDGWEYHEGAESTTFHWDHAYQEASRILQECGLAWT